MPTPGISRARMRDQLAHVLEAHGTGAFERPRRQRHAPAARRRRPCASTRAPPRRRCRRLAPVVALVRHEVLEDHLLDVAVRGVQLGERLSAAIALLARSRRCPTRIPLVNGIRSSPAAPIVSSRRAGCLVGEPAWTVCISARRPTRASGPARRSPRAAARGRSRVEHAEVRVRQQAALQRPLADPHDVGGEVLVAELASRAATSRVDLGTLAGQDEQLLDLRARRAGRGSRAPRRARAGGPGASRTSSTCSSTGTSARATA